MTFSRFDEVATTLFNNGYSPLPILPWHTYKGPQAETMRKQGKRPDVPTGQFVNGKPEYEQWRTVPIDATKVNDWISRLPGHGCGIRLGDGVIALDIDVTDKALAEKLVDHAVGTLGPGLLRYGKKPKALMLFRVEERLKKIIETIFDPETSKAFQREEKNLRGHVVEVLADGQQCVAYGLHPSTFDLFRWPNGQPTETPKASLPLVTEAQLLQFLSEIPKLLDQGWHTKTQLTAIINCENTHNTPAPGTSPSNNVPLPGGGSFAYNASAQAYAQNTLSNAIERIGSSVANVNRNITLNENAYACFECVKAGFIDYGYVYAALQAAAENVGLGKAEIKATLASAYGAAKPKQLADRQISPEDEDVSALFDVLVKQTESTSSANAANSASSEKPQPATSAAQKAAAAIAVINSGDDSDHDFATGLAEFSWRDNARFLPQAKTWMFWLGHRWAIDEGIRALVEVQAFMAFVVADKKAKAKAIAEKKKDPDDARKIMAAVRKKAKEFKSTTKIKAVEQSARALPNAHLLLDQLDSNPSLIGMPSGVLDLSIGIVRPGKRSDYITKSTKADFENKEPVLFLNFLDRIFKSCPEMIRFIKQLFGYSLTGSIKEHKFFFFYGGGGNGKSILLEVMQEILGNYASRIPSQVLLETYGAQHPTSIAALKGVRLGISSEIPAGASWNIPIIKDLTGSDSIRARKMHKDEFEFQSQVKLIMVGNSKPRLKELDEGVRRRLVLVPFDVTIPDDEKDLELSKKLKFEYNAIMKWAFDGYLDWLESGLMVPESVSQASKDYMAEEDLIGRFADEYLIRGSPGMATLDASRAYKLFTEFCNDEGVRPWAKNTFCKALGARHGFEHKRNKSYRYFDGVRERVEACTDKLEHEKQSNMFEGQPVPF